MANVLQVSATKFSRSFARYQDEAHSAGVIEVTSHDRVIGGYLSAKELENYLRLKKNEREVVTFEEFDDETLSELRNTKWGVVSE
ncbi:hypothetical protein [Agrobacterium larrymoorei]|uniref:Prevent-host-death protein n=1 Tax=Agrobacterium larrymoorei TaxID=160699 RepID=A0A4D7DUX5_9HYPH|nr:hypothetical protein [Agrobacterium larrymoorei]QCI98349.1 hypothetical protein CFBP5473_10785 [Agrobacterium larrymoorei]QYA06197.1 hypothetical protein J5285_08940 [Agrobacterium larrymoorei]